MPIKLDALIKREQSAIDAETDPRKLRAHQANLAAFLATKAEMDGDDDEDDKDKDKDDDEDGEDSKAQKAAKAAAKAKGAAEAAKHRSKAAEYKAKAAESEEAAKAAEEDDDEEEESEESEAAAPPVAHDALLAKLAATVAEIKQTQIESGKKSLIDGARKIGAITKTEAAWLADLSTAKVEGFLEMRAKAGLVVTHEEGLAKPKHVAAGTEESLPADTREMIESAVSAFSGDREKYRAELVKNHLAAHKKQIDAALNGAGGRF